MTYLSPGTDPAFLQDASLQFVITEGEEKTLAVSALACHAISDARERPQFVAIGLPAVWNWRGTAGKALGTVEMAKVSGCRKLFHDAFPF